ncbi:GspE/PulE family protein [Noviherbaspirillum massiliense]|uniref:GspE/PulE family protein n=1 Tax=Noviherbaspirillum massiliense TaxID=1465823 RepID=UPI0003132DDE|nr:GspE/PulE family protein [Noviherbaspirillum massiliense]
MSSVPADHSLSVSELRQAHAEAQRLGWHLTRVLEERLGLDPREALALLGATFHYPVLDMAALAQCSPSFELLPFAEATRRQCLVVRTEQGSLTGAFCDPFHPDVQEWAETLAGQPLAWHLIHPADFAAYLARYEQNLRAMDSILAEKAQAGGDVEHVEDLSLQAISEDTRQVVKLVHSTLYDALKAGASDIHLEINASGLAIKYRIDGVLVAVGEVGGTELSEQVISRIKVMSELDIAERRIPQDGRFKVTMQGREIDFRVSIMPSVFGEDAVLRILDRRSLSDMMHGLRLDTLGFDEASIDRFRRMASEPYGMVLVTGPTGSGKTTTLYAAISEINHGADKIITIEDPVEYHLPGVLQIPVNEKKGLTFARGLRSILRHDPDKIMIGEIRDAETAQIAIQSALTGHLVFTTVHANNVFDVIGRFMHMGVDPYSFVSALNGILAQRLVRVVCPSCAEPVQMPADQLVASGIAPEAAQEYKFMHGQGCGHCRGTGYKGRKAIAEMLQLNDEIRELVIAREPIRRIKEAARRQGTRYLREAALDLVRQGKTTLQEINRVTFVA